VSRRAGAQRWSPHARRVPFRVVAAFAALGGAMSGSLGCLADPPTFAPRGQVPPFILAGQVVPPLASIYEPVDTIEISVPFRSEDVNQDLSATLYLDLSPGAPFPAGSVLGVARVASGNYEELRLLTMDGITVDRIPAGCHSLTLIMTYDDNLDEIRGNLPRDEARAARLVWWLNVGDEDGETRMVDCPGASQVDVVPSGS
jgi:hypothetical protein